MKQPEYDLDQGGW